MTPIRIRSVERNGVSPWIYLQGSVPAVNAAPSESEAQYGQFRYNEKPYGAGTTFISPVMIESLTTESSLLTSPQFGQFRYQEEQYGSWTKEEEEHSSLELSTIPIRIRTLNGEYLYQQQLSIQGEWTAIRIRSRQSLTEGPWVYLQTKEV